MNSIRSGSLLVATHELVDPNFAGTVILLLDHDDEGTIGVVLNRPSEVPVSEPLPECSIAVSTPAVVFVGGPVGRETVIALGAGSAIKEEDWQPVADGLGIIDLARQPPDGLQALRVFAGYAGWSPGQLEEEVVQGSWWVVDGAIDDLLTTDPGGLWRRVLSRQGGLFRTVPDDPVMN